MDKDLTKGAAMVLGPDDGESYWQPGPHRGYMTVKLSPHNHPSNMFSMGIQVMPPGCHVRDHGHARNDEVLFIYEGTGRCVIDGITHKLEPGSTVVLGRYVEHSIHNDGTGDMKFVWFFTPPGLEQVVRAAGRVRQPGTPAPEPFDRPDNIAQIVEQAGYATPAEIRASWKR
ncbi:MAG TPA: cupin domain-containing protein [Casimicrobiaceae bacterium]|nr:cupin domain-containing protein [Casimicrobiaceae bacterium]